MQYDLPKEIPIERIAPPEQGFFSKKLNCHGILIKSHLIVDDKALQEAATRVWSEIGRSPGIIFNMTQAHAEVHIIGKDQFPSDLPELAKYKGKPYDGKLTIDERTRGVGGLQASCGEENLLMLPSDRYKGSDICRHEFAHTILSYGVDVVTRSMVKLQYRRAMNQGKWRGSYAASNYHEYWAELSMWYFGSWGYSGTMDPKPEKGVAWLKSYDPDGYELLDKIYSGRWKVNKISIKKEQKAK